MIGIKFGIKHSYRDFGMYLTKKEISLPKAKTEKVSVTGRDGDIDLTEALGDNVRFENRTLKFTFTTVDYKKWAQSLSAVANYLHGQKMQIIMDADPQYYYYGRCSINKFETNKATGKIVIEVKILASMFDMALEKAYGYLMHADDGDPLEKAIAYRLQEYKGEKIMKKMSYTFASFLHDCLTSLMDE